MILKAKHHFFIYPFFKRYTIFLLKRKFHSVQIIGEFEEKNLPVLIISNHNTWWDGFWLMFLNLKKIHRNFYFMMLEEQLRKHWYFNYAGGYSIKKSSRSIIESLQYTAKLLNDPGNMVFMFPQGEICSMHEQKITFERGIEKILNLCRNDVQIIFVANLIEYFSYPKPSLYIHTDEYKLKSSKTEDLENEYNKFYEKALNYQIHIAER
jgi:1-acyl-sn-glycerol-3-phosphate acyltransferase